MPMSLDEAGDLLDKAGGGKKKLPVPPDIKGPTPPVAGQANAPFRTPTDLAVNPSGATIGAPSPSADPGAVGAFQNAATHAATFGLSRILDRAMKGQTQKEYMTQEAIERQNHPWASAAGDAIGMGLGGGMISKAIEEGAPRLAGNTLPRIMGREAIAGGVGSGLQDIGTGETPDLNKAAMAAIFGGAGSGIGATAARMADPAAAVAGDLASYSAKTGKVPGKKVMGGVVASRIPERKGMSLAGTGAMELIGAGGGLGAAHFGIGDPYTNLALGVGLPLAASVGQKIRAGQRSRMLGLLSGSGGPAQTAAQLGNVPFSQRVLTGLMSGAGQKAGRSFQNPDDYMFP